MKTISNTKSAVLIAATVLAPLALPTTAVAGPLGTSEVRQWNICEWDRMPESVLNRITKRADYDDILRRMFDACPDSALGLTDRPTASISSTGSDEPGDKSDGVSNSGGTPGNSPGGNTGGGGGGGFGLPG